MRRSGELRGAQMMQLSAACQQAESSCFGLVQSSGMITRPSLHLAPC